LINKSFEFAFLQQTTTTTMIRLARRPTRAQSRHILSSLSIAFLALLAVVCFTQPALAEEVHPEYGTVIGIGM
jgi:heat shock protein 5